MTLLTESSSRFTSNRDQSEDRQIDGRTITDGVLLARIG